MSAVTIAGRPFALGVAYAPAGPVVYRSERPVRARRPIEYDAGHPYPDGRVVVEFVPLGAAPREPKRLVMSGRAWAAWVERCCAEPIEEGKA